MSQKIVKNLKLMQKTKADQTVFWKPTCVKYSNQNKFPLSLYVEGVDGFRIIFYALLRFIYWNAQV